MLHKLKLLQDVAASERFNFFLVPRASQSLAHEFDVFVAVSITRRRDAGDLLKRFRVDRIHHLIEVKQHLPPD